MVDNLAQVENGLPPPAPLPSLNVVDTEEETVSTKIPTSSFFCCLSPKMAGLPPYLKNPFLLRTLFLIIMQLFTLVALISQVVILYSDIQWNSILEGQSLVSFPTPQMISTDRYVTFDDPTLKSMLYRNLHLPIIATLLLATFLIFNILSQVYDSKNRYQSLLVVSLIYSLFAIALTLLAVGGICCTIKSSLSMYKNATAYLLDMIPLSEDTLPYEFPEDNPISVKTYPQYFYQTMKSCEEGDVTTWQVTSDLMGIRPSQVRIPSYRQLVQMGFCISSKTMYAPVVILFCLALLSATNVVLCLMIRKMGILFLSSSSPPTEQQIKMKEFEATLKQAGRLGDAEKILEDIKMNE